MIKGLTVQNAETPIHSVLRRLLSKSHLTRESLSELTQLMPKATVVAAASLGIPVGDFMAALDAGGLKPLPVLLSMAVHLSASEFTH